MFNLCFFDKVSLFSMLSLFRSSEINTALVSVVFTKVRPSFFVSNTKPQILDHIEFVVRLFKRMAVTVLTKKTPNDMIHPVMLCCNAASVLTITFACCERYWRISGELQFLISVQIHLGTKHMWISFKLSVFLHCFFNTKTMALLVFQSKIIF